MTIQEIIKSDLRKVRTSDSFWSFFSAYAVNPSFKRIFIFRMEHHSRHNKIISILFKLISRIISNRYYVYIDSYANIGSSRGGRRSGYPVIGNNVFIVPARIIGHDGEEQVMLWCYDLK